MTQSWRPDDWADDDLEQLFAREREAWRGDLHPHAEPWRADPRDDRWRGREHLADWPEAQAGPEYWMYKRAAEGWPCSPRDLAYGGPACPLATGWASLLLPALRTRPSP